MNQQYFEAILQLRNQKSNSFERALETIYEETKSKSRPDIFISKAEKVKGGVDIYLSSKKFARDLGKKMNEKFGGEMFQSPRLFSRDRQSSKDIYRLNVLVRLPELERGTVVTRGKDVILITGYTKGRLAGRNLDTGKALQIDYDDRLQTVTGPDFPYAVVSKSKPRLEVLHPETFESVPVENAKTTSRKKIRVALVNGKVYEVK
jgi:NMD protein affecting ribosome stability and mRNA decay